MCGEFTYILSLVEQNPANKEARELLEKIFQEFHKIRDERRESEILKRLGPADIDALIHLNQLAEKIDSVDNFYYAKYPRFLEITRFILSILVEGMETNSKKALGKNEYEKSLRSMQEVLGNRTFAKTNKVWV